MDFHFMKEWGGHLLYKATGSFLMKTRAQNKRTSGNLTAKKELLEQYHAEKRAKIMENAIKGWADLPLDIIEKIVYHAVKKEETKLSLYRYEYYERVHSYGRVHPAWKRAIIQSRTIFQRDKSLSTGQSCPKRAYATSRQFVKEGYIQAVQSFEICSFFGNLEFNHEAIAERNSIEWLRLNIHCNRMNEEKSRQINDFVRLLPKAKQFDIMITDVLTQNDAKWVWELMCLVVHTNNHQKKINYTCESGPWVDRPSTDWSFVSQAKRLDIGSIDELTIKYSDASFVLFSKLADIDTVIVDLETILEQEYNFPEDTKANRIQIKYELDYWIDREELNQVLRMLWVGFSQRSLNFETIEGVIVNRDNGSTQQQLFKPDATACDKIKDWFKLKIEVKSLKSGNIILNYIQQIYVELDAW